MRGPFQLSGNVGVGAKEEADRYIRDGTVLRGWWLGFLRESLVWRWKVGGGEKGELQRKTEFRGITIKQMYDLHSILIKPTNCTK